MLDFSVVQRAPGVSEIPTGSVVWRTCLREIEFLEDCPAAALGAEVYHRDAAYAHLLEVICGLGSPIVGETEVMHQFKAFVSGLSSNHATVREIGMRLLTDARTVRARHLIGLGSRSYGSAVRRHLREGRRVGLIGTGMLAQAILPFAADEGRSVEVWGRRTAPGFKIAGATFRCIADAASAPVASDATVLVVAATVTAATVGLVADRYARLLRIVDLRAQGRADPPAMPVPIVGLHDVFGEVSHAVRGTARRVAAARTEIRRCALAYATREKLRPSGWHDLCA